MKILAKTPRDLVISFNDEDFYGLSEKEKAEMITQAVRDIIAEQVSWSEIKGQISF